MDTGKLLVIIGLILAAAGGLIWDLGRVGFRGLPGDIRYEGENVRFYFPVATCLVLSVVITLVVRILHWLGRK